ncbi:hypothetical protein H113_01009 [Trichophyton rubrum MR1459]|uniref:Uncharacterized protein n=2 Tax=Trichophyton TaxID=5550 RepID=A0A022WE79_TRIRU|nr:hypothetical protein H100_01008 [Trichophyton rubrum MR850]EZF45996.1 hypothetical protein H102_00999 [Trichophyton rubrum CBS 100081]EZF56647.1 hypothetical protein H103_01008 [Trichophyton rubrum CBS 288.86]EZF67241.1 hypothetical protein H104_00992 [Trichophyton rubrum CBS 289.86]EZF77956.1 hypothetical protein H105_01005 [Trichophyton soudanense CBS 452.61]EZF88544.1 hypothetical protein H110_01008 [Trichophyton rubrum MR1448]EZF99323.1 hypothetical protein H113_01009 [Trichophyton rub
MKLESLLIGGLQAHYSLDTTSSAKTDPNLPNPKESETRVKEEEEDAAAEGEDDRSRPDYSPDLSSACLSAALFDLRAHPASQRLFKKGRTAVVLRSLGLKSQALCLRGRGRLVTTDNRPRDNSDTQETQQSRRRTRTCSRGAGRQTQDDIITFRVIYFLLSF